MTVYDELKQEIHDLDNALQILELESGKLAKQDILRQYTDLPYFKEVLHFLYNNYITTGISKKKLSNPKANRPVDGMVIIQEEDGLLELLDYLKENNTGRLVDVSTANCFITNFPNNIDVLAGIVTKDIPLGVSASTLNKVFGKGFVPVFDVMKGTKFDPDKMVKDGKLTSAHAITVKYDGSRCVVLIGDSGEVTLMARSGKQHEGYTELIEAIKSLGLRGVVLDGEMLVKNPDNLPSDELFTLTQSITRKKGEKTDVELHVYDKLSLEEFKSGKSKDTYKTRRKDLDFLSLYSGDKTDLVKVVPVLKWTNEMSVVQQYTDKAVEDGLEGIMLNSEGGYYTTTRTKQLLKVKQFHTMDLRVTGVEIDTRGTTLGAIVVDYKGNEVRVGSGFTAEERDMYWADTSLIIGKIAEVQYFETSVNKSTGKESLRFPTYLRLRDKNEVSLH